MVNTLRFFDDRHTYGMNACEDGKIWRAIDAYDYVCVDYERLELSVIFISETEDNFSATFKLL